MKKSETSIGILGAGISGLAVAFELQRRGYDLRIYEKSNRPGGVIQTVEQDDWKLELGPNTMLINSASISNFVDEIGLRDELIEANSKAKNRYILKNGELEPVPLSFSGFLSTNLLSLRAKIRLLKEPFIPASKKPEESISEFVIRRLGREPLYYAVNPFVSGVYAGDPEKLSIKHTFTSLYEMEQDGGSLFKGMLVKKKEHKITRSLISFKNGMQTLPDAIASKLGASLMLNTEVTQVTKTPGSWKVETPAKAITHDALICTTPAHVLNAIFDTAETKKIQGIPYASMSILHLGFKQEHVEHPLNGFGMLIPEVENKNILGCLFSSTLFPEKAPEGHALLTCFMGGARNPELAKKSGAELYTIALTELEQLLGVSEDPVFKNHTFWEKAIPQYELGYDSFLDAIQQTEHNHPGLFIGGNIRGGVSVPDCIANGLKLADRVEAFLES